MKTNLTDVQYQVMKFWSPVFEKELRSSLLLGGLVNKDYEGQITKGGDQVTVSQVNAPTGQLLTIGTDADAFSTEKISTSKVNIQITKRAVAAYEFEDTVEILSMIDRGNQDVNDALKYAMGNQINTYLYSLISPSTSAPDHTTASVTDMAASVVSAQRVLAGQAKWPKNKPWYSLLDPQYYGDVMDDTTLASSLYGATDAPMVGGVLGQNRFGFTMFEDNSLTADHGYFFHPDFLHLVMGSVSVKISDLHSQKRFGYIMSVDVLFGAAQGINHSKLCTSVTA